MSVVVISFAVYTLAIVVLGLYSARFARRSNEDFFLAGRSLGPWVGALSASASSESGWVTLGLVGIAFAHGVEAYWVIPGCLLGYLFNWFVLAGRLNRRAKALNALTLPDFFAFSFRERVPVLRVLSVIVIVVAMLAYVSAQMAAAGKSFSVLLEADQETAVEARADATADPSNTTAVNTPATTPATQPEINNDKGVTREYTLGVLIGAVIVLLYTVSGGFRAVCWTDFLQALLMVGSLVIFPLYLLASSTGYAFISEQLAGLVTTHGGGPGGYLRFLRDVSTPALIGFLLGSHALGINFGYPGMPHVLVRFMALKEPRHARLAGVIAFVWGLCVYWGAVTIGLFARATAAQHAAQAAGTAHWTDAIVADSEVGLVVSAMHLLPDVVSGLVLAAVLAAICSTADSQLVVAASSVANDLYARIVRKGEPGSHPWINRAVVAVLGVIAVSLVFENRVNVYETVLDYGWAMLGAAFGPQVILTLLWKRSSYVGCVAGMLVGFLTVIVWPNLYSAAALGQVFPTWFIADQPRIEIYSLPLAFVLALIVNVVFSLLIPTKPRALTSDPAISPP
ncbi:MAG: sodium/proline symporter [Phycisphaerae bacterium]|nr:sodium/proline symporter [Phycisphaerae bacterium]